MGGDAAARNQAAAGEQQDGAGSVEGCVEGGEEGVLFCDRISGDHAAGLMVWTIGCVGLPSATPVRTLSAKTERALLLPRVSESWWLRRDTEGRAEPPRRRSE